MRLKMHIIPVSKSNVNKQVNTNLTKNSKLNINKQIITNQISLTLSSQPRRELGKLTCFKSQFMNKSSN